MVFDKLVSSHKGINSSHPLKSVFLLTYVGRDRCNRNQLNVPDHFVNDHNFNREKGSFINRFQSCFDFFVKIRFVEFEF